MTRCPQRRKDIVWRHEARREQELLAAMERGEDVAEQGTVILVVDGTMHQLNLLGGEIWRRCDGEHSVGAIVDALAAEYEVGRDELAADVGAFLADLERRGWIHYE